MRAWIADNRSAIDLSGSQRLVRAADLGSRIVAIIALSVSFGAWQMSGDEVDERMHAAQPEKDAAAARLAPPTKETMVGFYGGAPHTYRSDVKMIKDGVHDLTVKGVGWDGEPFVDPIYYGVRVVRWLTGGRTGVMLDFTHSKTKARKQEEVEFEGTLDGKPAPGKTKLEDVFRRLEFSHGHNMLTLNGLWRLADLHPRLSPYVGIGVGVNLPHTEVQLKKVRGRTYEYQYAGPVAQALIGLEFRIPRFSYYVEYKFSLASYEVPLTQLDGTKIGLFADLYRQFTRWMSGDPPPGGFLSTRLTSHQVIGGIGIRFADRQPVVAGN